MPEDLFPLLWSLDLTTIKMSETLHKAEEVAYSEMSRGDDSQVIAAKVYEEIRRAVGIVDSDDEGKINAVKKINGEENVGEDVKINEKEEIAGEDAKIGAQDGKVDDEENESMPDLEEDGDAHSDDCTSSDFPSSDCSFCDSDSDDEEPPEVHEMNHNDKWKLVQRRGRSTVYKNGIVVFHNSERCDLVGDKDEFIRHRLRLDRTIGFRGQVEFKVWHHTYVTRSMEEYRADFETSHLSWVESPEHSALETFLKSMSKDKIQVTNIVCFCLGSLQTASHKIWKCRKSSRVQLAILLTVRRLLSNENVGNKIKCITQDPDFSAIDKKFLKQDCDIEVVDDPQGFAAINENTMVFMMGGFSSIAYVMSRGPRPAAFIQNSFERRATPSIKLHKQENRRGELNFIQRTAAYEEDSVEDMLRGCEVQAFPNEGGYASNIMEDAHVSWRRA